MSSSYVLTGGTGNTSLKIAAQLHEAGHKVIVASTKGPEGVPAPYTGVKFDWTDESTYSNALPSDANIKGLYLLSPYLAITVDNVKNFIHLARERGVNRFVSMTATTPPPHHLEIEAYIKEIGKEGVEWTILKPSWFYENFTRDLFAPTINASDSFNSATQNGKMGLVSSDDIADIAVRALTDTVPHNIAHIIFGPELLTYDDAARILSEVVGRKITHNKLSGENYKAILMGLGFPEKYAGFAVSLEEGVAAGIDERLLAEEPEKIVRGEISIREFFEKNKATWAKEK